MQNVSHNFLHKNQILSRIVIVPLLAFPLLFGARASAQIPEEPAPVKLRFAGKEVVLKTPALAAGQETYVPLEAIKALGGELKITRRNDTLLVKFRSVSREAELATARIKSSLMLALSDVARILDAAIDRPDALDATGKPVAGKKGDTVYLLAKVTDARFEEGMLRVRTSFPVPFRVRTIAEGSPFRGYIDCIGATFSDTFAPATLPETEKQALKLRFGRNNAETARVVVELADGQGLKPVDMLNNVLTQINAPLDSKFRGKTPIKVAGAGEQTPAIAAPSGPTANERNPTENSSVSQTGNAPPSVATARPAAKNGKQPVSPLEVRGVSFVPESDEKVRLEIATSRKVKPYVRYEHGTTMLVIDVPNALPRLPDQAEVKQTFSHPLVSGMYVSMPQDAPPLTRITLELNRVVGFTADVQNNAISLELRVPRSATGSLKGKLIVVDPGHGGKASGAQGGGFQEKHICLAIGLKLRAALEACGANVIMTRDRDKDVGLYERTKLANTNGADLFISIHNDSNGRPNSVSGTSVYYHMGDASSRALASCVVQAIGAVSGLPRRGALSDGILYASGLAVLRTSEMPAVLVEVAYINHSRDRAKLINPAFQNKIALAIVKGVRNYIEGLPQDEMSEIDEGTDMAARDAEAGSGGAP